MQKMKLKIRTLTPPGTSSSSKIRRGKTDELAELEIIDRMTRLAEEKGLTKENPCGFVRIKNVRCGKKACRKCPHSRYAYWRAGKNIERYIGVV